MGSAPPPDAPAAAKPLRSGLRLLLPLAIVLALLLLLIGLLTGGARWVLATDEGTAWLLRQLPMVQVKGYQGSALGERWRAESLRVEWRSSAGSPQWLLIEGLEADGLKWSWRPNPQAWIGLKADRLVARKLTLHTGPASGDPPTLPSKLAPPLHLTLGEVRIGDVQIDALAPIHALALRGLVLDPRPGKLHQVEHFAFQGLGATVEGELRIGHEGALPVQARASLRPTLDGDQPRWAAVLRAAGTLGEIDLSGTLRGVAARGRPAPMVDLRAALRPLQAWPLAGLQLQTQALDLAALWPQAPMTRLAGQAQISGGGASAPLTATLRLENAQPGRWDEQRLPVRSVALEASGAIERPERIEFKRVEIHLADGGGAAGRWTGNAVLNGDQLTLDSQLVDVQPLRLDGRAAAMTLSGGLSAVLRGLPSAAAPATASAAAPAPQADWKLDLQGQLAGAAQSVRLVVTGHAERNRIELTEARAESGSASAQFQARLTRSARAGSAAAPWQLTSAGKVLDFDPLPWWPGKAGSAWRKGPHRLSGDWQFEVQLPNDLDRLAPVELAQRLAGNGHLRINDSQLAGVPLALDLKLAHAPGTTPTPTPATLHGELRLGSDNRIVVDGRADPAGSGLADRWNVELKAASLSSLAPLTQLHPLLAGWAPRQGTLDLQVAAEGRWPQLRTEGSVRVAQLAAGKLALSSAAGNWRVETDGARTLSGQLDLAGLVYDKQRADQLRAAVRGTLADHRIEISGALPIAPPLMASQLLGVAVRPGSRAEMLAQGAWTPAPGGGGQWKLRVERLRIGAWDAAAPAAPAATAAAASASAAAAWSALAWIDASDLRAELQWDAQGTLVAAKAEPGRVQLANAAALRWDAVQVDLRGERPQISLRAEIEPFAVAPLLARAQPTMGWSGDLKLRARIDIRAAERMDADIVFERSEGDLHMSSGDGMQLLGLTELRLALSAHNGIWNFNPVMRGRSLGDIIGEVRVTTAPESRWPGADAPIEGSTQAFAADIGIWGAWVPPGWRLAGELKTMARISGRFGAPQYTGEISGNKIGVRNLLEGVHVTDGQVLVRLSGDSAKIERFTLKGGDGTLQVTGGASFGERPQARLQLKADKFRVLGRVDRLIVASGNAELQFDAASTKLDGKFKIDEGLIDASRGNAPSLDDDVSIRNANEAAAEAPDPAAANARKNFAMAIELDLGDQLRVKGYGVDTTLRGQLRLSMPQGRLAVYGSIFSEGGTFAAYGQKLVIERGIATFNGVLENPRLDVLALRPNIDVRVGASISGNLLTYRLRLYSEPEMSDNDKLAWLVLGRAPDGLGRNDTALLQRAAVALFAGEGEAPTDALMKKLGIDDVSLRQAEGTTRETVITIGKRLSDRWYLGYERGVNSTTGTWQLIYRIAQRFTLRLQSGLENAVDVIWTWRRQESPPDAAMRKSIVTPP